MQTQGDNRGEGDRMAAPSWCIRGEAMEDNRGLIGDHNTFYKLKAAEAKYTLFYKGEGGWITFGDDAERAARVLGLDCERLELNLTAPSYLRIEDTDVDRSVSRLLQSGVLVALAERIEGT